MKFNLSEKFKLNEKFELSEKFILLEDADVQFTKESLLQNINKLLNMLVKKSSKFNSTILPSINKINTEKNALQDIKLKVEKSPNDTKILYTQYVTELKKSLNGYAKEWAGDNTELQKIIDNNHDNKDVLNIISNELVNNAANINEIKEKINNCVNSLKNCRKNFSSAKFTVYTDKNGELQKTLTDIKTNLSLMAVSMTKFSFKKALDYATEFENNINVYCSNIEKIKTEEDTQKVDWEKKIDTAILGGNHEEILKIINDYFDEEWAGYNIEALFAIQKNLFNELQAYGFDESKNPFVKFLKKMLRYNAFEEEIYSDSYKYGEIHNAIIDGLISEKDLSGTGDLRNNNIVFCIDLYRKDVKDINEYLKWQKIAVEIFESSNLDEIDDKKKTKISKYGSLEKFIVDLLYKSGSIVQKGEGNQENGLNDLLQIKSELKFIFGDERVSTVETNFAVREKKKLIDITSDNINNVIKLIVEKINSIFIRNSDEKLNNILKLIIWLSSLAEKGSAKQNQDERVQRAIDRMNPLTKDDISKLKSTYFNSYNIKSVDKDSESTSILLNKIISALEALYLKELEKNT